MQNTVSMKCECSLDSSLCTEGSRQSKVIISPTVHTKRYTKSLTNKNSLDSSDLESQVFITDPENQSVFVNKTKTGCFAKRKIFCSAIIIVLALITLAIVLLALITIQHSGDTVDTYNEVLESQRSFRSYYEKLLNRLNYVEDYSWLNLYRSGRDFTKVLGLLEVLAAATITTTTSSPMDSVLPAPTPPMLTIPVSGSVNMSITTINPIYNSTHNLAHPEYEYDSKSSDENYRPLTVPIKGKGNSTT